MSHTGTKVLYGWLFGPPDLQIYSNFEFAKSRSAFAYTQDITNEIYAKGDAICVMGLRREHEIILFAGSTALETITATWP